MAKAGKGNAAGAVKRIMQEIVEMEKEMMKPNRVIMARPLESDLFDWHFSIRGPPDTPFEGGVYHGRILLPTEYPFKPPEIIILTPNGRFECGTQICLSVTSFHQETWQPSWSIRTILTALIAFMPTPNVGLGSLSYPDSHRRQLARASMKWKCTSCGADPFGEMNENNNSTPLENKGSESSSLEGTTDGNESESSSLEGTTDGNESESTAEAVAAATALFGGSGTMPAKADVPAEASNNSEQGNVEKSATAQTVVPEAIHRTPEVTAVPQPAPRSDPTGVANNGVPDVGAPANSATPGAQAPPAAAGAAANLNVTNQPFQVFEGDSRLEAGADPNDTKLRYLAFALATAIFAILARRVFMVLDVTSSF